MALDKSWMKLNKIYGFLYGQKIDRKDRTTSSTFSSL